MKNWIRRALRTFCQTAVGYICTAVMTIDWTADRAVIKAAAAGIITSAIAGGVSAVMNLNEEGD